jgi:hypothetical protein
MAKQCMSRVGSRVRQHNVQKKEREGCSAVAIAAATVHARRTYVARETGRSRGRADPHVANRAGVRAPRGSRTPNMEQQRRWAAGSRIPGRPEKKESTTTLRRTCTEPRCPFFSFLPPTCRGNCPNGDEVHTRRIRPLPVWAQHDMQRESDTLRAHMG